MAAWPVMWPVAAVFDGGGGDLWREGGQFVQQHAGGDDEIAAVPKIALRHIGFGAANIKLFDKGGDRTNASAPSPGSI